MTRLGLMACIWLSLVLFGVKRVKLTFGLFCSDTKSDLEEAGEEDEPSEKAPLTDVSFPQTILRLRERN